MFARFFLVAVLFVSSLVNAQEFIREQDAFASEEEIVEEVTLDEVMNPDQLATEVGNPHMTIWEPLAKEAREESARTTKINPYKEFPLVIEILKSVQRMHVYYRGELVEKFRTSTGREEWEQPPAGSSYYSSTPNGWYAPQRYVKKYRSRSWGSMMRYSIFFNGGIAIHATSPLKYLKLGKNTSGGCVRLTRGNAKWLFNLATSQSKTMVPVYTRSGRVLTDAKGNIQRKMGSSVLIVVKD